MEVRRDEDFLRVLDYGGPKLDPFMATNTNRRISHRSRKEERRIKSRVSTETAGRPPHFKGAFC
jgi:glutamate mutase epsilon subunit